MVISLHQSCSGGGAAFAKPSGVSDAEPFFLLHILGGFDLKDRARAPPASHRGTQCMSSDTRKVSRTQLYRSDCGKKDKLLLFPGPFSAAASALNSIIAKMKTTLKRTKRVEGEDALIALSPQESLLYHPQSGSDFLSRVGLCFVESDWGMPPTHLKKKNNPSAGYESSRRFWGCSARTVGCLLDCLRTLGPPND